METRALLAIVLSIAVLAGFQYFFGNQMVPTTALNGTNATNSSLKQSLSKNVGKHSIEKPKEASLKKTLSTLDLPSAPKGNGKDVIIETPLFRAVMSENGATFKHFVLKKYKESLDKGAKGVDLINVKPPILPLGVKIRGSGQEIDLRTRLFSANAKKVILNNQQKEAQLIFKTDLGNGVILYKDFLFKRDSYVVQMTMRLEGASVNSFSVYLYDRPYKADSAYIFSGPSYYTPEKGLEEIELKEVGDVHKFSGPLDWVSFGDNYFMIALVPLEHQGPWRLGIKKLDDLGLTESRLSGIPLGNELCKIVVYLGPKEIDRLKAIGHNLSEAINFGWFDPIAKPLLYVLNFFYKYLHNYGVAIIVLTVLIKVLFWPLAHKSAQSMKTMQKLQPKLQKLKEKYGDDKERLNKELMQLYRTYKVNPMSGCLPMLLQIPVFFALYKVLLQAIELRHAPFALWINDLSAPDRLMIPGIQIPMIDGIPVLTLLMGASMYLQQKMSPSSLDPTQAKMMQFLPIIFTFMFINFPSGLVLYWLVNNILSIVQQYYVNKFTE